MKFKQYLNEKELSIDEIISLIKRDCQPFLKDFHTKYKNNFLYSGRSETINFIKKTVRKNRNPKDTPLEIHKFADDWFYKKFHIRLRSNALFCSFDKSDAENYGNIYMIFPIDKYSFYMSKIVEDLYIYFKKLYNEIFDKIIKTEIYGKSLKTTWNYLNDEQKQMYLKILGNKLNTLDYQKNVLIHKEYEIMLHCKNYYMLNYNHYKENNLENLL